MLVAREEAEPMPDTPLTRALEALVAVVQSEGVHVAAQRLERDPTALPGLARCVLEAQRATMTATWELACCPAGDMQYDRLMERLGLGWCSQRPPLTPYNAEPREPHDRFRFSQAYPHPSGIDLPAIMAPIQDAQENLVGLAIWFLKPDWSGLTDLHPKMVTMGEVLGHCVRLRPIHRGLVVAIDLESAAVAHEVTDRSVWLTLTADNLTEHFLPPFGADSRQDVMFWFDDTTRDEALKAARRVARTYRYLNISLMSEEEARRGYPRPLASFDHEEAWDEHERGEALPVYLPPGDSAQ